MLIRLFYVSEIVQPLTAADVQVILGASQMKNRRADITGMLVQTADHFLQVIEGRAADVKKLMGRIARDARHRAVREVLEATSAKRLFPTWSKGLALCPTLSPELEELHRVGTLGFDEAISLMERANSRRTAGAAYWS